MIVVELDRHQILLKIYQTPFSTLAATSILPRLDTSVSIVPTHPSLLLSPPVFVLLAVFIVSVCLLISAMTTPKPITNTQNRSPDWLTSEETQLQ